MEQGTVEDAGVKATTVVKGTKSSICPYEGCGKSFTKPSNLIQHMRTHSGEKPYSCHICSKRFGQLGNLTKHLRSHENAHLRWNRLTKDKPFKCLQCERSFTANSSLRSHIRMQHNETTGANDHSIAAATASPLYEDFDIEPLSSDKNESEKIPSHKTAAKETVLYHCCHPDCSKSFETEKELRSHQGFRESLAEENASLRATTHELMNFIADLSKHDSRFQEKLRASGFEKVQELIQSTSVMCDQISAAEASLAAYPNQYDGAYFNKRGLESLSDSQEKMSSQSWASSSSTDPETKVKTKRPRRTTNKERSKPRRTSSKAPITVHTVPAVSIKPEGLVAEYPQEEARGSLMVSVNCAQSNEQAFVSSDAEFEWDWCGELLELELFAEQASVKLA